MVLQNYRWTHPLIEMWVIFYKWIPNRGKEENHCKLRVRVRAWVRAYVRFRLRAWVRAYVRFRVWAWVRVRVWVRVKAWIRVRIG